MPYLTDSVVILQQQNYFYNNSFLAKSSEWTRPCFFEIVLVVCMGPTFFCSRANRPARVLGPRGRSPTLDYPTLSTIWFCIVMQQTAAQISGSLPP